MKKSQKPAKKPAKKLSKPNIKSGRQDKSSLKKPLKTMEELLKTQRTGLRSLKRGDKVKAKILKLSKREIVSDINGKSYALTIGREFEAVRDFLFLFKAGEEVETYVIIPEMEGGETLISFKRAAVNRLWENLKKAKEKRKEIEVTVLRVIQSGLLVDYHSLRGFIPQTQLDLENQKRPEKLMGQRIKTLVLEVNQKQNRLVLSHKEITQKDSLRAKRKAILTYTIGEVLEGQISKVGKYSLKVIPFIKNEKKEKADVEGLVHISEISWERIEDLSKRYKEKDKIKAKIIDIDKQKARIVLSIKELMPDPWKDIKKKYAQEKTAKGKVVKITSLGVFVELDKGVEGLIHSSKIPAGKEFKIGEKISVVVDKIDEKNRKLSLVYLSKKKPIGYR